MNINAFAEAARAKSKGKVKAPIAERWNKRVIPRGLDRMGRSGARAYLDAYGKGIAAPKVTELALCAEYMGANEMAAGFWEAAYNLATGDIETYHCEDGEKVSGESTPPVAAPTRSSAANSPTLAGLPPDMQPGKIETMQPVDADRPQSHYILSSDYLGQPKRDGHRNVLFATETETFHQSRSTAGLGQISPEFEEAAKAAAEEVGPFVLDGERYYRSVTGSEHRTSAQAATANAAAGQPKVMPVPVFGAFEALYANGRDLRNSSKEERIQAATGPVALLASHLPEGGARIEAVTTARTTVEKAELANTQQSEGREGEVWTHRHACYEGGKKHGASVRTKYTQEGEFTIIGVKFTTAQNRTVGSFEVADENGNPLGNVGTGFDAKTGEEIATAHAKNPGSVRIKVRYQGKTEKGTLWHPRMLEMA